MIHRGYDIPGASAVIIGGDHITGTLHRYDNGAQQGPQFVGINDTEVIAKAKTWLAENRMSAGRDLYPEGLELRLRP